MIAMHDLRIGDTIFYKLRPQDLPTDPDKLWKGRVRSVIVDSPRYVDSLVVDILEPGFEDDTEIVYPEQLVSVQPGESATH
jgi:hypothetical protein